VFVTAMRQDTTSALSFAARHRTFAGSPAVSDMQSLKLDADRRRHMLDKKQRGGFGVVDRPGDHASIRALLQRRVAVSELATLRWRNLVDGVA
jgi:hypothetical protein